nr:uncharacterized protein LOC123751021 [Procambarus clarkii]
MHRLMVLGAAVVVMVNGSIVVGFNVQPEVKTHQLFTPIPENCTQSLVELLLLRQEIRLDQLVEAERSSGATLAAMALLLTQLRDDLATKLVGPAQGDQCTAPFSRVGDTCLLLAVSDKLTWAAARQFCAARGADLVVFRDANAYADALGYINLVNCVMFD